MSGKMSTLVVFFSVLLLINKCLGEISDKRLCADPECKEIISEGRTVLMYNSIDKRILSFPANKKVKIYSKSAGSRKDLWGAVIDKRRGYIPKRMLREYKIYTKDLQYEVSTESVQSKKQVDRTDKSHLSETNDLVKSKADSQRQNVKASDGIQHDIGSVPELATENLKSANIEVNTSPEDYDFSRVKNSFVDVNGQPLAQLTPDQEQLDGSVLHTAPLCSDTDFQCTSSSSVTGFDKTASQHLQTESFQVWDGTTIPNYDEPGSTETWSRTVRRQDIQSTPSPVLQSIQFVMNEISSDIPTGSSSANSEETDVHAAGTDFKEQSSGHSAQMHLENKDTLQLEGTLSSPHDDVSSTQRLSPSPTEHHAHSSETPDGTVEPASVEFEAESIFLDFSERYRLLHHTDDLNEEEEQQDAGEITVNLNGGDGAEEENEQTTETVGSENIGGDESGYDSNSLHGEDVLKTEPSVSVGFGSSQDVTDEQAAAEAADVNLPAEENLIVTTAANTEVTESQDTEEEQPLESPLMSTTAEPQATPDHQQAAALGSGSESQFHLQEQKTDTTSSSSQIQQEIDQNLISEMGLSDDTVSSNDMQAVSSKPYEIDQLSTHTEPLGSPQIQEVTYHGGNPDVDKGHERKDEMPGGDVGTSGNSPLSSEMQTESPSSVMSVAETSSSASSCYGHSNCDDEESTGAVNEVETTKDSLTARREIDNSSPIESRTLESTGETRSEVNSESSSEGDNVRSLSGAGETNDSVTLEARTVNSEFHKGASVEEVEKNISEETLMSSNESLPELPGKEGIEQGETLVTELLTNLTENEVLSPDAEVDTKEAEVATDSLGDEEKSALDSEEGTDMEALPLEAQVDNDGAETESKTEHVEDEIAGTSEEENKTIPEESTVIELFRHYVEMIIFWFPEPLHAAVHDLEKQGVPPRVVVVTVIVAVTCIIFFIVQLSFQKFNSESKLIKKISDLDKQVYRRAKELELIQEELVITKEKLQSVQQIASGSQDLLAEVQAELQETKIENDKLLTSNASLQQELETATEAGLELNKMVTDILSSQSDSGTFRASLENLQLQLDKQQQTIDHLSGNLSSKIKENEILHTDLLQMTEKTEKLEEEANKLTVALKDAEEIKSSMSQDVNLHVEEVSSLKEERKQLTVDIQEKSVKLVELSDRARDLKKMVSDLQESLSTKDCKIEALEECLTQLKVLQDDGDQNEQNGGSKLAALLNVGTLKAELKATVQQRHELQERLDEETGARSLLAEHMAAIKKEMEKLQESQDMAIAEKIDAETKLEILSSYFKEKEAKLQKELGLHEAQLVQSDKDVTSFTQKLTSLQEEVINYKAQTETLAKEIEDQEQGYKTQLAAQEKKAHDNWVAARQAERKLEEAKSECSQLRNRLTQLGREKETLLSSINQQQSEEIYKPTPKRFVDANGELPVSPDPATADVLDSGVQRVSGHLYQQSRDMSTVGPSPALPFMPIPLPGIPPISRHLGSVPPPIMHSLPPFIDPRPTPVGRMSSPLRHPSPPPPPLDRHSIPSPYDRGYPISPPPRDRRHSPSSPSPPPSDRSARSDRHSERYPSPPAYDRHSREDSPERLRSPPTLPGDRSYMSREDFHRREFLPQEYPSLPPPALHFSDSNLPPIPPPLRPPAPLQRDGYLKEQPRGPKTSSPLSSGYPAESVDKHNDRSGRV